MMLGTLFFGLYSFVVFLAIAIVLFLYSILLRTKLNAYAGYIYTVFEERGIEALECLNINDAEQWVHIRGRDKDNPILLFIHGGPGMPHIGWFDAIQRPWEDYFTVVQWDQRQTGKSYAPVKKIGHTVSHQQMISDAESVVAYLRQRFSTNKIFIMGTSYGTYIGMHLINRHPDWFHAYVAIGQLTTMMTHAEKEYDLLYNYAREVKDKKLLKKMEAMQPYPNRKNRAKSFFRNVLTLIDEESRLGKCFPVSVDSFVRMMLISQWLSPLYSWRDLFNQQFGDAPVVQNFDYPFSESFMDYDLPKEVGNTFDVPIFFFTGSHDWHVAHQLTDEWYKRIRAEYKEQIWFKHSAHVPYITEPGEFLFALVNRVLPLCKPVSKE